MKRNTRTKLGWALFVCGIIGGLYLLRASIGHLLLSFTSLITLLEGFKPLAVIGLVIAIWQGWSMAHPRISPGYNLPKESLQEEVDIAVNTLRVIADEMGVRESNGKSIILYKNTRSQPHTDGDIYWDVRKVVNKRLDQRINNIYWVLKK
ncbi:hypothetical protein ACFLYV_02090 [Chloroflexota bacterium]